MLPHRYPFRLLDARHPDGVVFRLGAAAASSRPAGAMAPILALEILAQAALVTLPEEEGDEEGGENPRMGYLAGIDGATFDPALTHRPLAAGDTLIAAVARGAGYGRLLKVHGVLRRDGEQLVEAELVLSLEA